MTGLCQGSQIYCLFDGTTFELSFREYEPCLLLEVSRRGHLFDHCFRLRVRREILFEEKSFDLFVECCLRVYVGGTKFVSHLFDR